MISVQVVEVWMEQGSHPVSRPNSERIPNMGRFTGIRMCIFFSVLAHDSVTTLRQTTWNTRALLIRASSFRNAIPPPDVVFTSQHGKIM